MSTAQIFDQLMAVIEDRKSNPPPKSYTTSLFAGGVEAIGAKVLEEANEVVGASREVDSDATRDHIAHEAADLIYHLFVMMAYRGVSLDAVCAKLAHRFGTSGLDEKESRRE